MFAHVNTTRVLYEMLRGRWSFIFHLCDFGPFNSSPAFSVAQMLALNERTLFDYVSHALLQRADTVCQ